MIAALVQDVRHGLRGMSRAPGVTAVIVATLALGIGANTTIFSLVSALMLRPLPGVARPGRLVSIRGPSYDLSYPDIVDYRAASPALSALAARRFTSVHVRVGTETRRLTGALVSSNYFAVLGVIPALGRGFAAEEEGGAPGAHPVAIIGYDLWRRRLGRTTNVIGATIGLNGQPFTVVGVAPEGFHGVQLGETEEIWVPLSMYRDIAPGIIAGVGTDRWPHWLHGVGRLSAGALPADAQAQVDAIDRRAAPEPRPPRDRGARVTAIRDDESSLMVPYFAVLSAVVGTVLVLACTNVANLSLARGSARRREFAVRSALGATRGRLVRQLLIESLLFSLAGTAAGLLLTWGATTGLLGWLRAHVDDFPGWLSVAPDARVFGFAAALAVVTSLLFGAAPALHLSRPDLVTGLKDGVSVGTRSGSRFRRLLVVLQVSASVVLLSAAGLLVTTLQRRWAALPVVAPGQVLQVWLDPALGRYSTERANALYGSLLEQVRSLPGVQAAALARNNLPWDRSFFGEAVAAQPGDGRDALPDVNYEVISPGYFQALGHGLRGGRDFSDRDRVGAPGVVIVNETLARQLWPGANPIGRRLTLKGGDGREVVGVARDRSRGEGRAFMYLPMTQPTPWERSPMVLHVRAAGDPQRLIPALHRVVSALDPDLPVYRPRTVAAAVRDADAGERLASMIVGSAALLALALAVIGLYGVMSYGVAQRVREFGVRTALGAGRGQVLALVLKEGMTVTAWGLAVGSALALPAAPAIMRVSTGFDASADSRTLVGVVVVLAVTGLLACLIPARRAVRVDPVVALRND